MSEKRAYKQYSKEFKEEAVALVTEQGYSVAEAAKSLGVRENMLYRWKQKLDDEQASSALSESEREELKRLRQEVKALQMEKEILKKASVGSIGHCNRYYIEFFCGGLLNETDVFSRRAGTCF